MNSKTFYYPCPHCDGMIEVKDEDINCGIFRHGIYNNLAPQSLAGKPLSPHASKKECELASNRGIIFGCGKPIQMWNNKLIECDYI